MSQKYNMINNDALMEVSIEKSHYNDKSRYYNGLGLTKTYGNYEISQYSHYAFYGMEIITHILIRSIILLV